SLAIKRQLGDKRGTAYSLNNLGTVAHNQGEFVPAWTLFEESLALSRDLGDKRIMADSLMNLGSVASDQGRYAVARPLLEESLAIKRQLGDRQGLAYSLEAFAALAAAQGQTKRAAREWGASERLRKEINAPLPPNIREKYDRQVASARQALGEEAFSA